MASIGELAVEVKDIKKNSENCEKRQVEEHKRFQYQLNDHIEKNEKTKIGIYEKITSMEYEFDAKIRQNVKEIKTMIKDDIITPLGNYKKASIKVVIGVISGAFMAMGGFIWWLLSVTNVITKLQDFIGG